MYLRAEFLSLENMGKYDIRIERVKNSKIDEFDSSNLKFGKMLSEHMFVADYTDGKWQDARIIPYGNFEISPANSAIHYGQSIFEGMKAFKNDRGEILLFRPDMNAARFNRSAERMCMAQLPEDLFIEAIQELLRVDKNWIPDAPGSSMYIRPFMFATDSALGVKPSETYRFMVINSPSGPYYAEPVRVKIETDYTRAASGGTGAAKTAGNYAASLFPAQKAKQDGFDQIIWTDGATHTFIEEAGTMNIMFVIDGVLRTCPLTSTILPGVTRDSVLKYAAHKGMEINEAPIKVDELIAAIENKSLTEAFGVGTAVTVSHIKEISYKGKNHNLPPIESRPVANDIHNFLEKVKRGQIEDELGWITKFQ